MSDLRDELYTAVDALIVRESLFNGIRDIPTDRQEKAVEDILDILIDLFSK